MHSAAVATTVASVGPYVLSIRRPGVAQRATSSAGHASPPSTNNFTVGSSTGTTARKDGTVEKKVTLLALMNSAASKAERTVSPSGTTSVPPTESAPQISSTDASKAIENPW